jgi:hypothetical protein
MPDGLDDLLDDNSTAGSRPEQRRRAAQAAGGGPRAEPSALRSSWPSSRRQRASALDSLFAKHSIPAKARDFFPTDADPTDEAATAFVEKYGELWGASAQPATTPPEQQAATAAVQQFVAQAHQNAAQPLTEDDYAGEVRRGTDQGGVHADARRDQRGSGGGGLIP